MTEQRAEEMLHGVGVSRGKAQGKLLVYTPAELHVSDKAAADTEKETVRFLDCVAAVRSRILKKTEQCADARDALYREILDAHLEILEDSDSLLEPVKELIRTENRNASAAINEKMEEIAGVFDALEDEYLRQRAADIRDLKVQLLCELAKEKTAALSELTEPVIVAARDLSPSDTISMDREMVIGIVCEAGGKTSHTSVLANAMGIPAVMGCTGLLAQVCGKSFVQIDGDAGTVTLDPNEAQIERFAGKIAADRDREERLRGFVGAPTYSKDGRQCLIYANIAAPEESRTACESGCEGIGLFRSEFLYYADKNTPPSEETQRKAYVQALRFAKGRLVIVRTLDAGGDKPVPALNMPQESNPFLGRRAIRLCLEERAVFRTQLRALLRAANDGPLQIMLPMISGLQELRAAKEEVALARDSLRSEGLTVPEKIPVGIMIEVPSAVMMADELAQEADFFSIGTNDLTQYTLAADRGNEYVSALYSHYDPAVVRMIAHAVRAAHRHGIHCGMCGEAAGDMLYAPLLLGLGLDEFSVAPRSVAALREEISRLDCTECEALAGRILLLSTKDEIVTELRQFAQTNMR